jgi:hypothetical protein
MTIKNQIKSFTAKTTKDEVSKFFIFMGGISGAAASVDDTDISLVSRITQDEVSTVVPRVNWSYNSEYEPYYVGSLGDRSYVYNNVSDIVYLCVGKNQSTGLIGENPFPSTQQPTHTNGIQLYSDGYAWMAMYKIDFALSKFLTETVMPVSSLYDYTTQVTSGSYSSKYNSLCSHGAGVTGSCYFYYNQDTIDPLTSVVLKKGDLVSGVGSSDWTCSVCHSVGDMLGYKSIHIDYLNSSSAIVRNPIDELVSNLGSMDVNNRYYIHYNNYLYGQNLNGGIVYLQLDVSSLSIEDRIVTVQKPEITILDPLGIGAAANIETYYDIRRNAFIANGITLRSAGANFVNPHFSIPTAVSTKLQHAINAVLMPDLSDPSTFLPTPRISIIKQLSATDLTAASIETNQTVFSKVGIVKNLKTTSGVDPTINLQPNESDNGRMTTLITLDANIEFVVIPGGGAISAAVVPNIEVGEIFVDNTAGTTTIKIKTNDATATQSDYNSALVAVKVNYDEGGIAESSTLEIAGADELLFNVLTAADQIEIDDDTFVVSGISNPKYELNNVEYVSTKILSNNISFDTTTGSDSSAKLSFLI